MVNDNSSPSTSVPARRIALAVSSGVVTDCALATGTSFTAAMLTDTVTTAESTCPSLTLNVNESEPFTLALGV